MKECIQSTYTQYFEHLPTLLLKYFRETINEESKETRIRLRWLHFDLVFSPISLDRDLTEGYNTYEEMNYPQNDDESRSELTHRSTEKTLEDLVIELCPQILRYIKVQAKNIST